MPPTASELKPAPRCCCVLGTVADVTELGSGHKAVLLRVALHAGVHEEMMLAPTHAARAARQLLEAAKACGESGRDVTLAELELAAIEPKPVRHPYSNTLPTIEYVGGFVQPSTPTRVAPLISYRPRINSVPDDVVDALWARFCAGEGGVNALADARGINSDALRHGFEHRHGPEFALVRNCYRGRGRTDPAMMRQEIAQLLSDVRLPVTKPNGRIL